MSADIYDNLVAGGGGDQHLSYDGLRSVDLGERSLWDQRDQYVTHVHLR